MTPIIFLERCSWTIPNEVVYHEDRLPNLSVGLQFVIGIATLERWVRRKRCLVIETFLAASESLLEDFRKLENSRVSRLSQHPQESLQGLGTRDREAGPLPYY